MKIKDLCGKHKLSGVDQTTIPNPFCDYLIGITNCIRFRLDGVSYLVTEDPDDGYRSYLGSIEQTNDPPKFTFPETDIICSMSSGTHDTIMSMVSIENGLTILEIGTDYTDSWHPFCVFRYYPENLPCNAK